MSILSIILILLALLILPALVITFEGKMGSGKSLSATAFAVLDWYSTGRQIVANYSINLNRINDDGFVKEVKDGDFEYFDYEKFVGDMKNNVELYNKTVVLDEAYLFMDSRRSQSGFNNLMTYFTLQTRKRGVDLYICTQQFTNVDLRLRQNADIRATCRFDKASQVCRVRMVNMRDGTRRVVKIYGPEYYKFFDTNEIPPLRSGHLNVKI